MTGTDESVSRVDGSREARLDQVIAQELHADPFFAGWLWVRAGGSALDVADTLVQMNRDDIAGFGADAHGETDVHCSLTSRDGEKVQLFIENKVFAGFQPRQPERYRLRADSVGGRALLITPERFGADAGLVSHFHGHVTIQEVADYLEGRDGRRGQWIASLLRQLTRRPGREPAVSDANTAKFTAYCVEYLRGRGPVPAPRSLHTLGQGWLDFESPNALVFKAVGVRGAAMVDLYVGDLGVEPEQVFARHRHRPCVVDVLGVSASFHEAVDSKHNRVLRFDLPMVLSPSAGVPSGSERDVLHLALEACVSIDAWLETTLAQIGGAS